jgi:hypothetical protein
VPAQAVAPPAAPATPAPPPIPGAPPAPPLPPSNVVAAAPPMLVPLLPAPENDSVAAVPPADVPPCSLALPPACALRPAPVPAVDAAVPPEPPTAVTGAESVEFAHAPAANSAAIDVTRATCLRINRHSYLTRPRRFTNHSADWPSRGIPPGRRVGMATLPRRSGLKPFWSTSSRIGFIGCSRCCPSGGARDSETGWTEQCAIGHWVTWSYRSRAAGGCWQTAPRSMCRRNGHVYLATLRRAACRRHREMNAGGRAPRARAPRGKTRETEGAPRPAANHIERR